MKNSLSRRLFQKYGLPPRGYQWGATSFLPTQGTSKRVGFLGTQQTECFVEDRGNEGEEYGQISRKDGSED